MEWNNKLKQIPMKLYHSSNADFDEIDMSMADPYANYSQGFYTASNPKTSSDFGDNLYEFNFSGGNYFDPETFEFNDEIRNKLLEQYITRMKQENYNQDKIDDYTKYFVDDFFTNQGKTVKNIGDFINWIKWLDYPNFKAESMMEKVGMGKFQGIRVPTTDSRGDYYVTYDPKTLKMVRKTKNK